MEKPYKEGTVKLTWINPEDFTFLESSMYISVQQAIEASRSKNLGNKYLIMQLESTDGKQYKWKLLPYGEYQGYVDGMRFRNSMPLKIATFALIFLGTLYIYKIISKKI
jgi:hypothetical protein